MLEKPWKPFFFHLYESKKLTSDQRDPWQDFKIWRPIIFLIRIDFYFNHLVISLVLATLPYGKANVIEMIEDLARVTHGNVRCFHNL